MADICRNATYVKTHIREVIKLAGFNKIKYGVCDWIIYVMNELIDYVVLSKSITKDHASKIFDTLHFASFYANKFVEVKPESSINPIELLDSIYYLLTFADNKI